MRKLILLSVLLCASLAGPAAPRPVYSADGFGSGLATCAARQPVELDNPTVLSGAQCTRAGIQAALDNGGQILLDCGTTTIPIDQTLELNPRKDTLIDGGGRVTLDGQNSARILSKGWHDASLYPSVTITLQNLRLINGKAPGGSETGEISGGALAAGYPGTRVHIINSTFENNSTTDVHTTDNQGGAIFVHNAYELVISGSVFRSNSAGNGGAIGIIAAGIEISNSIFSNNQAVDATDGGVVRGYGGVLHLDGVHNDYNPDSSRRYTVCGSQFEGNSAIRGGGALSSVVSDGFNTQAWIERSQFTDNRADGYPSSGDYSFGQGGAIYHIEDDRVGASGEKNFLLLDSTFDNNSARKQGGAIWISVLGQAEIANVTFNANSTSVPINLVGQGGAASLMSGTYQINNTLFANNHAAAQGGALFGVETVTLTNTIFYNNTLNQQELPFSSEWQGFHTDDQKIDGGQNIQFPQMKPYYNNEVNNRIVASPIFVDPLLGELADNGGPTFTRALLEGSPAIDQGSPAGCRPSDQRGLLRLGTCDIGPFEYGGREWIPSDWMLLPAVRR